MVQLRQTESRQPWWWRPVGGQFWREWWRLGIFRIAWEITHKLCQHARTRGPHPRPQTDAQGLRRRYVYDFRTNATLHPALWDLIYGSCRCQNCPSWKPPIQWCFATARHPNILSALTHDRHIGRSGRASIAPPRWRQRCRLPSERGKPPICPPQGSQRHVLQGISGLGAPKSWIPHKWRNQIWW